MAATKPIGVRKRNNACAVFRVGSYPPAAKPPPNCGGRNFYQIADCMNEEHRIIVDQIPHLRRYARALLGDKTLADDLVQECLTRAMDRLHLWRPGSNMRVWLMAIMHNLHINDAKRRSARPDQVSLSASHENLRSEPPGQDTPLMLRDMNQALNQLPDDQRHVILLIGLEGLEYAEAADVLDIPIGTVMSRLGRGRKSMREFLDVDGAPRLRSIK